MSLRARAITGVKWVSFSTGLTVVLGFVQTAVLSQLLNRKDFGLMSMIWVVFGFVQVFSDMGVSNAIVRTRDMKADQLSSLYWLNLGMGVLMAGLVVLSTPLQVRFYHEPALSGLIPWVALTFVFTAAGQTFQMVAQRDLHFHRMAAADVISVLSGACVAIGSAYAGYGVYSLVAGGICSSLVKASLLMFSGWREWHPSLHFRRYDLSSFIRFGAFQTGERLSNYAWSNLDYLTVGRFLGADALGIYRISYELVVRPLGTINAILNTVSYPIFSRKQSDDGALARGMLEVLRLAATLICPILCGLLVVAPYVVPVVFGEKWNDAVPIVQILCPLGILRSLSNPAGSLILAKGRVELAFYWNLAMAVTSLVVFWFVAPFGLQPLAWSVNALFLLMVALSWKSYYYDTVSMQWTAYLHTLLQPVLFSVVMALSVYGLRIAMPPLSSNLLQLAVLVPSGIFIYFVLHLAFARDYVQRLIQTFRRGT